MALSPISSYTILRQNRATKTKVIPGTPHFEAWTEIAFIAIRDPETKRPVCVNAPSPDDALAWAKQAFPRILLAVEPSHAEA